MDLSIASTNTGSPTLEFRLFSDKDDVVKLNSILQSAYRPLAEAGMRYAASHEDVEATRSNIEKGECHIVIADGEPIACVMLRPPGNATGPDWYSQPGVATFGRFAVAPDFQKLGNRIEERAKEMGATEIALDTSEHAQHLIKMYADRGYRFIQYHKWEITNYRSVVLSKELK